MQYEPLDMTKNEIRVLEFLDLPSPVSTEGIIRCSIRNVSLGTPRQSYFRGRKLPSIWDKYTKSVDSRHLTLEQTTHAGLHGTPGSGSRYDWGDFEALSYTWGDTSETKTIQINGVHKDVPRNLEEALRALRNLEETLSGMCYWIDSLCIDQENIEERNEQVKRMKEIYGRARAVIVWLGQEEEQDGIAVQIMQQLCNGAEGKYPRNDMVRREWPAIIPFAQKPYWSRCWIIQELAMNHNATLFLCGEFELTRKMIESGARWGLRLSQDSEDINHQSDHKLQLGAWAMVTHMDNLIAIEHKGNYRMGVDSLLHLIRRAGATDEKDKIYSILGLLDPAISAGVTPDYSLSVQQVYTEFMKSAINGSGILDQVVFAGISAEQGWPSWVPDWREPFRRHYPHSFKYYYASRYKPAKFRFIEKEKDRTYLACSGVHVDTVDGIAAEPPLESHTTQKSVVSDRYSGQTEGVIMTTFGMGDDEMSWVLFNLPWSLSHDTDTDHSLANVPSNSEWRKLLQFSYFERWDKFRKYNKNFCIGGRKFQTLFLQSNEGEVYIPYVLSMMRSVLLLLDHRALITTRTGYLGLAPVETRLGDVVAILLGCCWPVVLRPCDDGHYQLIGECYIHGLMNGEIFDQQQDEHLSEQEFILC